MAELVDAPGSGLGGGNTVEVRVLFRAPLITAGGFRTPKINHTKSSFLMIVSERSGPVETTSIGTPICFSRYER